MTNFKPEKILAIAWMARASCVGEDISLWFPSSDNPIQATTKAKAICAECPVKMDCLELAIAERIPHGIWGGMTSDERNKLRHARYNLSRKGI